MKALILERPGQFRFAEVKVPGDPNPGEALVRVHRVGVCGTDLHAFEGRQTFFEYPRILGHELCVEILALAETDSHLRVGDHLVGPKKRADKAAGGMVKTDTASQDGGLTYAIWVV